MFKKSFILFFVFVFAFFAFLASAQTQTGDVAFSISPEYPQANQQVGASLSSYTTDLNKARISWTLNGQLAIEAVGQKNFSFKTGDFGTQTTLAVQIQTSEGDVISKQITINPVGIDLLWEAQDVYVPPFYQGKALIPGEGMVKVVALPNSVTNEKYVYNWKLDDNNKPDSSGYAKNFYSFRNSFLETSNAVDVSVSDLFGNNIGTGKITLKPSKPKILFYEKDLNLGIKWEKSLSNGFSVGSEGETLVAEPYFFSPKNLSSSALKFVWYLGGSQINTPDVKNEISLRPQSGNSGSSTIQVSINNIKTLFLSLDKALNVNF